MKECNSGTCLSKTTMATLIVSGITLLGGAILGSCLYAQISNLHKAVIEMQFGSKATFEKFYNARMTEETQKQIEEQVQKMIESLQNNETSEDQNKNNESEEDQKN